MGPSDAVLMRIGTMHTYGVSWYHGGPRHGYELGVLSWDLQGVSVEGFYRYTAANGWLLKVGMSYVPEEEVIPTLAVGYAF